jgi:hypothetical protein
MKCQFLNYPCELRFARYHNTGNIAVQLVGCNPDGSDSRILHGEPVCTATTNIEPLPDGCVAVKNYSENTGMVNTLTEAGLIEAIPFGHIDSGFVRVPVHKLTPQGQVAVAAQLGKEMARG